MKRVPSGLYPKKYGQVILKNLKVARFEAESIGLPPGSNILEIGPGPGTLTEFLLEAGYKVTAVESDHRFVEELGIRFAGNVSNGSFSVVKADFLEFKPGQYDGLAGNIPYQISSEVIFRIGKFSFRRAIFMLQREFCERLVARTGSSAYSRLTVNAQLRYNIKIIARVSRRSFFPQPSVDSAVVLIEPRNEFDIELVERADKIFKLLFSNRRKKISTVLKGYDGIYKDSRVEEISPPELLQLSIDFLSR